MLVYVSKIGSEIFRFHHVKLDIPNAMSRVMIRKLGIRKIGSGLDSWRQTCIVFLLQVMVKSRESQSVPLMIRSVIDDTNCHRTRDV